MSALVVQLIMEQYVHHQTVYCNSLVDIYNNIKYILSNVTIANNLHKVELLMLEFMLQILLVSVVSLMSLAQYLVDKLNNSFN